MRAKRRQSLSRTKSMKLFLAKLDWHQRESPAISRLCPAVLFRPARPPSPRAGRLRLRMGIPLNSWLAGGGDYHRLVRGGDTNCW
jgi:hypothetical protein